MAYFKPRMPQFTERYSVVSSIIILVRVHYVQYVSVLTPNLTRTLCASLPPTPNRSQCRPRSRCQSHTVQVHLYLMCSGKVTSTLPFFSLSWNPDFSPLARKFIPTRNPFAKKEGKLFPRNAPNSFLRLSHSLTCMVPSL